jgi:hypothetical protein
VCDSGNLGSANESFAAHTPIHTAKDTRWQTFLAPDPGEPGNSAPAPFLERTRASLRFQRPWQASLGGYPFGIQNAGWVFYSLFRTHNS